MWEPYKAVAKEAFPNCIVAIDPFHYIKHLCDDFNRLRINLMNQQEYNSNSYYLLKKWHFLLDKDDVDLNNPKQYNKRFGCELLNVKLFKDSLVKIIGDVFECYDSIINLFGGQCQII